MIIIIRQYQCVSILNKQNDFPYQNIETYPIIADIRKGGRRKNKQERSKTTTKDETTANKQKEELWNKLFLYSLRVYSYVLFGAVIWFCRVWDFCVWFEISIQTNHEFSHQVYLRKHTRFSVFNSYRKCTNIARIKKKFLNFIFCLNCCWRIDWSWYLRRSRKIYWMEFWIKRQKVIFDSEIS